MNRRKFIIGAGSLAAGGAAAIGSGAFSTVQASRDFTVSTSGDAGAELALEGANDEYVTDDGVAGELTISFNNLNPDAVTGVNKLFKIKNNADHSVEVWGEPSGPHADKVVFVRNGYTNDSQATLRQSDPPKISANILDAEDKNGAVGYTNGSVGKNSGGRTEYGPGKQWSYSMVVDTRGISNGEKILNSVTIYADNFDPWNRSYVTDYWLFLAPWDQHTKLLSECLAIKLLSNDSGNGTLSINLSGATTSGGGQGFNDNARTVVNAVNVKNQGQAGNWEAKEVALSVDGSDLQNAQSR